MSIDFNKIRKEFLALKKKRGGEGGEAAKIKKFYFFSGLESHVFIGLSKALI